MAEIEKQSLAETGLRSDVITLYGGAKYHLYRFKKYTDVRLVWAPEAIAAVFRRRCRQFRIPALLLGRDAGACTKMASRPRSSTFSSGRTPAQDDGELVFVSGNPGNTQRITTLAGVKHLRDDFMPYMLNSLSRMEIALQQYTNERPGALSPRQRRPVRRAELAKGDHRHAAGLQTPEFIERKAADEESLRSELQASSAAAAFRRSLATTSRKWRKRRSRSSVCSRLPQSVFHHCQAPGADGDRRPEAQRRPAPRIPRVEPRVARTGRVCRRRSTTTWRRPSSPRSCCSSSRGGDDPLEMSAARARAKERGD